MFGLFGRKKAPMTPEEGTDALIEVCADVQAAQDTANLDSFDGIFDRIEEVMLKTGVDLPNVSENLAALRSLTTEHQQAFANTDAAMWAGDLDRAKALIAETNPYMDDEDEDEEEEIFDLYADIAAGRPGAIEAFIATGQDPNVVSGKSRCTALFAALDAPGRRAEGIEALIAAGADATALHDQGDDAISWAMGYHHPDTVTAESERDLITLLAAEGADPDHEIPDYWVTLHRAIIQGGAPQVAALLAAGADPSVPVFPGFEPAKLAHATPLMLAAPKPDVVNVLLAEGADPSETDALGRSPVDFIEAEAKEARARATEDDPWTVAHADALEHSLRIISAQFA